MGGNVFSGATRPFGMVKLGPDVVFGGLGPTAGVPSNGDLSPRFSGFSMTHMTGTGGTPMYGAVSQLPWVGDIDDPFTLTVGRGSDDVSRIGYYHAVTSQTVRVELAATDHAGMYNYTFPNAKGKIVVDLSHRLRSFDDQQLDQQFYRADLKIDSKGSYQGSAVFSSGYNMSPQWTIYFCMSCFPLVSDDADQQVAISTDPHQQ